MSNSLKNWRKNVENIYYAETWWHLDLVKYKLAFE